MSAAEYEATDVSGRHPLLQAVKDGDLDAARRLLQEDKTALSALTEHNESPLYLAALFNHVDMVRLLLALGADPRAVTKGRLCALYEAVRNGWADVVRLLLQVQINWARVRGRDVTCCDAHDDHETLTSLASNAVIYNDIADYYPRPDAATGPDAAFASFDLEARRSRVRTLALVVAVFRDFDEVAEVPSARFFGTSQTTRALARGEQERRRDAAEQRIDAALSDAALTATGFYP